MAESVTLRKVFRDQVNTKFGPGVRTSIFVAEYPEVRMSSFTKGTETWKEGDKVMVDIQKNGEYTNFKPADTKSNLEARVERLEKHVGIAPEEEAVIEAGASLNAPTGQQNDFDDFK